MTSVADVDRWAPLIEAVRSRARVAYLDAHGSFVTGTLRYLCPPLRPDGEPRDGYASPDADLATLTVRVTMSTGFERWEPAAFLADAMQRHELRVEQ